MQTVSGGIGQPNIRLPMWKLSACLLAAPKLILFGALAIAIVLGGDLWDDRLKAEFWDGVVLYAGTVSGLGFLWMFGPRPAFYWAPLVIASSVIRMGVSLGVAVLLYSLIHPEKTFFWAVFLLASFAILAVETVVVKNALGRTFTLKRADEASKSESKAA